MEALIAYSLVLFFGFFLLNYAEISARPTKWLKMVTGPKWGYPLSCAFCWGFWASVLLFPFLPWWYLFTAPVVHLFVDLGYSRLTIDSQTNTYQEWRDNELKKPLP